jgi:hypothetical protein
MLPGKIDLILKYKGKIYALELKSFKNMHLHEKGIEQAAEYGRQMCLKEVGKSWVNALSLACKPSKIFAGKCPLGEKVFSSGARHLLLIYI